MIRAGWVASSVCNQNGSRVHGSTQPAGNPKAEYVTAASFAWPATEGWK